VVSTSANRSGQPPLGTIPDLVREFGGAVDLILEDPDLLGAGPPSTLVDATAWPPRILRAGSWDVSALPRVERPAAADGHEGPS
jgi:L-threonylcarbamoyladenylate synthase